MLWEGFVTLDELDVVSQSVPVLELLARKHEVVLIRRNMLLLGHLSLDDADGVCELGLDCDGLA
jgi:hypothetical protein